MHLALGVDTTLLKEELGCGQVSCFSADITIIMDSVTTNSPADTIWYHFLWVVGTDDVQVHGFVASWECSDQYEKHGVGAGRGCCALGQVVDFGNAGSLPVYTIRNPTQGVIFCNLTHVGVESIAM